MDGWMDGRIDRWLTLAGKQSVIQSSQPVSHSGSLYVSPSVCLSVCLGDWAIQGRRPSRHSLESMSVCSCFDHSLYQRERER